MKIINNKLIKIGIVTLTILIILTSPPVTSAHILKTDGSIGAVLHIDPEDDPIVNQQAGFFFEFKDIQNRFDPKNCDCTFSIIQSGKEIYQQPLFQGNSTPSLDNASVFYVFPERDVYQVIVSGTPKTAAAFSNFKLVFDIRVARVGNISQTQSPVSELKPNWVEIHKIYIFAGVFILVSVIILFIVRKLKK